MSQSEKFYVSTVGSKCNLEVYSSPSIIPTTGVKNYNELATARITDNTIITTCCKLTPHQVEELNITEEPIHVSWHTWLYSLPSVS